MKILNAILIRIRATILLFGWYTFEATSFTNILIVITQDRVFACSNIQNITQQLVTGCTE